MKKTLLFVLALAVIPVGVDAQNPDPELVRVLAEQGVPEAQTFLGDMYADGDGVPEDDVEAVRWYQLAADGGDMAGQIGLSDKYFHGEGVPEDYVLSYMWINLAAAQGSEGSQGLKDFLEEQMTREQIAEAQRMSREWLEAHPPGGN